MIEITVDKHGPLFRPGEVDAVMTAAMHEMTQDVARGTKNEVLIRLGQVIRHPTPYYETRIQYEGSGDEYRVNDGPNTFIYGPWLEGTGSRNATTRFKGYRTFRIITAMMNAGRAKMIAEATLARYIARLQ